MNETDQKFQGKFRIPSARLKGWDYASPGYYFVTICTQDRQAWLGEVRDGEMSLSPAGAIVAEELVKTPQIRSNVGLDAWVVMPNHVHAILVINPDSVVETPRRGVSTLGMIVNQIKGKCTKRIRLAGYADFAWQSRFYDHIIRDERSLEKIRLYILGNPVKWEADEYFL